MRCCCITGCHNRAEKGHRLYKLPQGRKNETRRKLWIQNIGRRGPLPIHAYVCQDHFTDDQFELRRADHKRLLKWNAVPTIFSHPKTSKRVRSPSEQEAVIRHESSNSPKRAAMEENLNAEVGVRTKVQTENYQDNSDEVVALKCKLNASLKEIRTLRTIISQLQAIIKKLIDENSIDKT